MKTFRAIPDAADGFWVGEIGRIRRRRLDVVDAVSRTLRQRRAGQLPADHLLPLVRNLTRLGFCRMAQRLLDARPPEPAGEERARVQFHLTRRCRSLGVAAEALARQVDLDAMTEETRFTLADAYYQSRQNDRAAALLEKIPAAALSPHVQELLFHVQQARGRPAEAQALVQHMMASRPHDTVPHQLALQLLLSQGVLHPACRPSAEIQDVRIPQTLFHYWHDHEVPAEVQAVIATWRSESLHHVLFDDRRARRFIAENFSARHLLAYERCYHPAMRSDFIRLCYLASRGGLYVDVDEAPRDGVGPLLGSLHGHSLAACLHGTVQPYANNGFIAASPGHPVITAALEEACEALCEAAVNDTRPDIWVTTGPGVITRNLVRHLFAHGPGGILLLARSFWDQLVVARHDLAYKATPEGNWRLA